MIILKDNSIISGEEGDIKVKGNYEIKAIEYKNSELVFNFNGKQFLTSYRNIEICNGDKIIYEYGTKIKGEEVVYV